jgi:hypothetical protein
MNEIVILIIGYAIGALSVSLAYAIHSSRKFGEYEDELQRLRATRYLLKDEIIRMEKNYKPTKPVPRKFRKRPKPVGKA